MTIDGAAKVKIKLLNTGQGVAYVEAGTGEALVFVHGSLCDYRYWQPQMADLSASHRTVAPSLSHHHPRLPSAANSAFSWRNHVALLGAFLGKLNAARIHLVGHSRGACIAYQVAAAHPGLLTSLTLVDPGGPINAEATAEPPPAEVLALRARAAALIAEGRVDDGLMLFVDSVSQPGFWARSLPMFQAMARDNAATLAPQLADPLPAYLPETARAITCPTLLVDGSRSPAMYQRNADWLAQQLPAAQRATIIGASHGMTSTHAQAFNRTLRTFLGDVRAT